MSDGHDAAFILCLPGREAAEAASLVSDGHPAAPIPAVPDQTAAEAASLVSDGHFDGQALEEIRDTSGRGRITGERRTHWLGKNTLNVLGCGRGRITGERRTLWSAPPTSGEEQAAEAASLVSDGHSGSSGAPSSGFSAAEAASLVSDGHCRKPIAPPACLMPRPRPHHW